MIDLDRLVGAYRVARGDLLAQRVAQGYWVGELSSSALSTATAASALAIVGRQTQDDSRRQACGELAERAIQWLAGRQNADGGWGDTDKSLSNIATTMLVRAGFELAGAAAGHEQLLARAGRYIEAQGGLAGLRRRYGQDKTFAAPIAANCALAGLVPWREVPPLPFDLACLPYGLLRLLRLPVVSYAVPALVAIGQARYFHCRPLSPVTRLLRWLTVPGSLRTLKRMQPASGGYLEAVPLTSFVVMSLASTGRADHPVVRRGVKFLLESIRQDGSWPIDSNLATWNTTLAVGALAAASGELGALDCLDWVLSCQHQRVHPFTHAAPGGWGWSNLSGAVPDVDDTSGALLALAALMSSTGQAKHRRILSAAAAGVRWLLETQNSDGGWPTFCRGWGTMPFDRSGADLTAHAIRALNTWQGVAQDDRIAEAIQRGFEYLGQQQRADGSWSPLWFGNQYHPAEENPVYGTARVLLAYRDCGTIQTAAPQRGLSWLVASRGTDGGWNGGRGASQAAGSAASTVEETALAVEALLADHNHRQRQPILHDGLRWLVAAVSEGRHREAAPIGFYFAKLWYYERLYPLVFTVSALGQAVRRLAAASPSASEG